MVKYTLSGVAFLVLIAGIAAAEGLTLDAAIETAIANNRDLQKSAVAYQQAKRAKDYGWNQFLPGISALSLGLSNTHRLYPAETAGSSGGGSNGNWSWNSINIGASITFNSDIPIQLKLLDNRYRRAGEDYEKAVRDLSANVAVSFYELLKAKMNIAILEADLELKKAQYDQVNANYNRGLVSELDLLNAQYAYLIAGPSLNSAVNKYREDLASFFILIGLDVESPLEPEGTIEIVLLDLPPAEELIARYLPDRSDIQAQMNTLEQTKLNAESRIRQAAPSLNISERLNFNPGGFQFEDPSVSGTFSVSLSIPIDPWIPGSAQSINRENDKENVAIAEAALDSAKKAAAQDIQKKVNAVIQNSSTIESSEFSYRIAARAYELTEQGYRSGLVSQTDLQSANQKRVGAEQAAVTAKTAYISAVYNLSSALNLDIAGLYELYAKK
ncbi:MAG: TolC family protein [Treponema sp.]|jgi:multidrug efflux system outer membrane protein|nr:TolC family protein [Treponema sp.]